MTPDQALTELGELCGIFPEFIDLGGKTRSVDPDTRRALIRANGFTIENDKMLRETLNDLRDQDAQRVLPPDIVMECGAAMTVPCAHPTDWRVISEGSEEILAEGKSDGHIALPTLPMGVHDLSVQTGKSTQRSSLIVAPGRTPSLRDVAGSDRTWGIVAALYGLRSDTNAGLGDFEDLARLGEILGGRGAGFVGINPVHALGWADEAVISPYSPTHRGFLNINHINLGQIPDVPRSLARETPQDGLIDYRAFGRAHRDALRVAFAVFNSNASAQTKRELQDFRQAGGQALADFALFETLSETLGSGWRKWPAPLRTPATAAQNSPNAETGFHIWLQWVADRQLSDAQRRSRASGAALGLYLDLAVGARLDGAEAWGAAETLASGVSLGAPPDQLSPAGQNWQLAAYAPRKLTAQKYAPLRQVLRQSMRHCGVLRIDHALGLNRSYWIPENGAPGGYIRQPFQSLMAIIAIEAQRAGTVIVGEDLGLVPDGFRDTMMSKGLYGYTVVQYEKTSDDRFRKVRDLRPQSLACFGTHDTPTLKGFWEADDIAWWRKLDWIDSKEQRASQKRRQREKAALMEVSQKALKTLEAGHLADKVHRDLAQGPTALVAVQLDDVIGLRDAQNLPGTIDEHPNWRRRVPVSLSELARHKGLRDTASMMAEAGRSTPDKETRKDFS